MLALEIVSHRDENVSHESFFKREAAKLCRAFILLVDFSRESSIYNQIWTF